MPQKASKSIRAWAVPHHRIQ